MSGSTPEQDIVDLLIVDDKMANIVSLEAILRRPDYNLISVTTGQEGLKHVLNRDFAVILLDVMMPEMDGFEFARLLKKRNRANPTPIIFLTAIATDFRYLVEGYAVGAVDYLQKPLDPEIVKAKVAVFVDLFRKNQRIKRQEAELREIQRVESERRLLEVRQAGERHYTELAESIPQVVWSADPQMQPTYFNRRWTELTGIPTRDALSDVTLRRSAFHPDDLSLFDNTLAAGRQSGKTIDCEIRLREKDTQCWRWQLFRGSPERQPAADGATGAVIGWHGTFTDIHHQKRIERAQRFLAETNMLFTSASDYREALGVLVQKVVPGFADGCVVDLAIAGKPFRRYVAARDALTKAQTLLGGAKTRDDAAATLGCALDNCKPTLLIPGQGLDHIKVAEELKLSAVASAPIEIRGGDAGAISFFTTGCGALDQNDLDLVVETCRHVAIAVENALVREESEENVKRKDEFLAMLSHELRTPLNAVIGWAELLKLEEFGEETLRGLDAIERNAKSLAQLVGDLLDVSRIITGKMEIVHKPVEIGAFLSGICESLRPLADAKHLDLTFDLPATTILVAGDQGRLQQVFWNLLTNAIKFTPEGGTVKLSAGIENGCVVARVRDSGIGIERAMLPYVFERFRQADSSRTRRHGGLGLGLSIVKHIVDQHNGTVIAESDGEGLGTTFSVQLPLLTLAEERVVQGARDATRTSRDFGDLAGLTVLLVDDDASSRMLTATFLKFGGATVRTAASVDEAITQLELAIPDVVLTDIGMPDADGFQLLGRLKALADCTGCRPPIAALSAYASPEDSEKALAAGFDRYLTKPIQVGELIAAVLSMAGRAAKFQSTRPHAVLSDAAHDATLPP